MNNRQKEEFAKLLMDIGKLTLASLVFGFFQTGSDPKLVLFIGGFGLTSAMVLFIMGLRLFKEVA
ncbi:hypothetical protein HYU96_00885 [Candidatus Daviesbacteria bacterium]|nr:hypothetical protein [Candidatus Daviesbacteria bacterium]